MTARQKTAQEIAKALKSENLATPGGCKYYDDGKRCIVGEVLSQCGATDEQLKGNGSDLNHRRFDERSDLRELARGYGLDDSFLSSIQSNFDSPTTTCGDTSAEAALARISERVKECGVEL